MAWEEYYDPYDESYEHQKEKNIMNIKRGNKCKFKEL